MKQNQHIVIGILAGIASGLMVVAALRAGISAFFLIFAAPAAIYIASMGWGSIAGLISASIAAVIVWYVGGVQAAIFAGTLLLLPAAWVGHLTNLGQLQDSIQEDHKPQMIWYPLSSILFQLMVIIGAGFIILGIMTGYSTDLAADEFSNFLIELGKANPESAQLSNEEMSKHAGLYAQLLPLLLPAVWLMFHAYAALLGAVITQKSEKLARDSEDVAATVYLPIHAFGLLAAGFVGVIFFTGAPDLIGKLLLGLSLGGFGLIGLAELHFKSRKWSSRSVWLWLAYLTIFSLSLPILIFSVVGINRSIKFIKKRKP